MPAQGFNIGKDVSIDIVTAAGGVIRGKVRTGFTVKQLTNALKVDALDGNILFDDIPAGWDGTLDLDRGDSTWDDYFAAREEDYYNGVQRDTITLTQTITEVSGATTQYRFSGVSLKFDDAGSWMADKTVPQKVSWKANRRRKIA